MEITKENLQELLKDVEARFNAAKVRKEQAEATLETEENECMRLQGEYRAIQELVNQAVETPKIAIENEGKKSGK